VHRRAWARSLVPLTVRHRYAFEGEEAEATAGGLRDANAWDMLRLTTGVFGLPAEPDAWRTAAQSQPALAPRAIARERCAASLCSYGVGTALVESFLLEQLALTMTEYAPQTVERLQRVAEGAAVVQHDLRLDGPLAADLHLFHRIDTELTNRVWRQTFSRYPVPILFVPGGMIGTRAALRTLKRQSGAFAGYLRTERALRSLWSATHSDRRLTVADVPGFLLEPHGATR
jgi:hypothetical protein